MTLQEAKDQVAKDYGYPNWWSLDFTNVSEEAARDEAAELYARNKWDEALNMVKTLNPYKTDTTWAIDETEIDALKHNHNLQL